MIFPIFLEFMTLMIRVITGIIISIITYIIGIFIARKYARKKDWGLSKVFIFLFIFICLYSFYYLIIDTLLGIFFLFLFGDNLLIDVFRITINILIGTVVIMKIYNKGFRESFIFSFFVQCSLFAIAITIELILSFTLVVIRNGNLSPPPIVILLSFVLLLGITIFYVHWGDKMQLIDSKLLISLASVFPAFIYITNSFFLQLEFANNLIIALAISIILAFVLKQFAYKTIKLQKLRELTVLEKGKNLLQVKDLKVYYPLVGGTLKRQIGVIKAVNGISFEIKTGETLGLVGESGCGKTTAALAILGLVEKTNGNIRFHDKLIPDTYSRFMRQKIQIVYQDPDASLNPRMKIVNIISEPLKNLLGITKKSELRKQVLELMKEVALKREQMDRYPHEFSGGQKQRIVIARALASNPELIILDEPTSALDVSVQAQILNLLKQLQKNYGYGFLFITHNLSVVNHIADRVAVMYLGQIVEIGDTDQIFARPTHPYTQALLASRSEVDMKNREIKFVIQGEVPSPIFPPPGCTFNPRCSSDARTKECEFELPHKIKINDGHYIWCVNPPISKNRELKEVKENAASG